MVNHGILQESAIKVGGSGFGTLYASGLSSGGLSQRVQLGDAVSTPWVLYFRVPEELIIFPMLFNIYMKPLGEVIRSSRVCCCQYADDKQPPSFSSSAEKALQVLECCLTFIMDWMRANKLTPNPNKTATLLFR